MFKKPVWDDLSFLTWWSSIILLEVAIRRWYTVVIKGWTWSATILREAVVFKRCSIGTKEPKVCQEDIPHTITPPPPAWTVETRQDGSCFNVLHTKFWLYHLNVAAEIETHQTGNVFPIFYCPILVSLCELYPPCPVLIWQERHPVWFSAAVAHLLQGSTCCAFRDGILHTLVGYLIYCCLSIISNQSAHFPLTSDTNKAFSSTQLQLTGYFLCFGPFSVNPRDGCVWKSQ